MTAATVLLVAIFVAAAVAFAVPLAILVTIERAHQAGDTAARHPAGHRPGPVRFDRY